MRRAGEEECPRPTLGFLIDWLEEDYQQAVLSGVIDTVARRDCNLVCFAGGGLRSSHRFGSERNFIYDLAGPHTVDALLVMAGSVSHAVGSDGINEFCARYRPLPTCSIALEVPGIPSVLVDNGRGMHDAIVHLIVHHGFRRIAFVRGPVTNEEAERRYSVYCQVLSEHGIAVDPELVIMGDFSKGSTFSAVRKLLQERALKADAIVAANDVMALDALDALAEQGVKVPDEVAVVGFDDIVESRFASPPLTTVRQPLYEQGARAAELVLDLLSGRPVPPRTTLLTEIVLRRSCGCFAQSAMAYNESLIPLEQLTSIGSLHQVRPLALSAMQHAARGLRVSGYEWNSRLFDAFVTELTGRSEQQPFLVALDELIHADIAKGSDASAWHDVVTALRGQLLASIGPQHPLRARAENIWQHARLLITSNVERVHVRQRLAAEQWVRVLSETNEAVITTFDISALSRTVAEQLPRLGIPSCYLALFDIRTEDRSRVSLVMSHDERRPEQAKLVGTTFSTSSLVPAGLFPSDRRVIYIVEPLFFRQQRLGFAVFEMGPRQGVIYEALRDQISAALKGGLLVQEVFDKNREREQLLEALKTRAAELELAYTALRENQNRLLASEKNASIGRLTASIAHEMNSPVAAARAALLELGKLITEYAKSIADPSVNDDDHREIAAEMHKAQQLAAGAAERAADFVRSIKNQTRDIGIRERVRFDAVASVREALLLLGHAARSAHCQVNLTTSADRVELEGPPGRLGQVVTNLLSNAIDAMDSAQGGVIDVELREYAHSVTLRVSDRGPGVPDNIRSRIWEPLFTTKPFGHGTGLGLTIVKDIVSGDFAGTVAFAPRDGGGAVFTVEFPNPTRGGAP